MADLTPKPASAATAAANGDRSGYPDFADMRDFEAATRGLMAPLPDRLVANARGSKLWDLAPYDFIGEVPPPSVNPSLWRIARLNMASGLFEVTPGVYQLRGIDLANMTVIEGQTGIIVLDCLTTAEVAAAALDLYRQHRGDRPIRAVIYSHSHIDHFGGARGVLTDAATDVPVIAPDGFMEALGGENVLAGNAMSRRAQFQFGGLLKPGPLGQVDAGLGKVTARGTTSLVAPTWLIKEPVERHVIDGVEIVFQLAPETEAPAEMHFYLPGFKTLNMAENTSRHLHNFIPLRGAVARDPRIWAHYVDQAIELFGADVEILIGQHHWPTWGRAGILDFLGKQRDLYKHIHDQTCRLMNLGLKPAEISERLALPPGLAGEWYLRGYYGTVSHNSKAVYQRYLSWYDSHPSNLDPLPPSDAATKTVAYMGGADAIMARARADLQAGEYRWVAQVMRDVVYAEPDNEQARALLADALEQLGYQAESATWRNAYLYGAQELRAGIRSLPPRPVLSPDMLAAVATDILFDFLAIRLDPALAGSRAFTIGWRLTDTGETLVQRLSNATLTHIMGKDPATANLQVTTTKVVLVDLIIDKIAPAEAMTAGTLDVAGDAEPLTALFAALSRFEMQFPVLWSAAEEVRAG